MSDPAEYFPLTTAAAYLLPVVVWAILADDAWRFRIAARPRSTFYRLLPWFTTSLALFYLFYLAIALAMPIRSNVRPPCWFGSTDVVLVLAVALSRHMAWHFHLDADPPSRSWLAFNYGAALAVGIANVFYDVVPAPTIGAKMTIARAALGLYVAGTLAASVRRLRQKARPGPWRAGAASIARGADVVAFTVATLGTIAVFALLWRDALPAVTTVRYVQPNPLLNATIGLAIALPFAVRILGDLVKRLLVMAVIAGLAVVACAGISAALAAIPDASLPPTLTRSLLRTSLFVAVALALLRTQEWLSVAVEKLVSGRHLQREAELRTFMQTLSPELGASECCRRAGAEIARVLNLRGCAILLTDGRGTIVHGDIDVAPLERVWRGGAIVDEIPTHPFMGGTFRDLPVALQEALLEADVVAAAPIASPRRRWGVAFARTGALAASFGRDDKRAVHNTVDQLALVLDGTELLERTLAVERSLAHAQRLAAIGELAARIAHEIRNPVTAARSLAQLLARDPTSPLNGEHADLILEELERVERQVAALLRFARREEFRFEEFDLGELVRETADAFRERFDDAGVAVAVDAARGIGVRADREKLRQVLINLLENALDALESRSDARRLGLALRRANGACRVTVDDNGPGVPEDALPRLFEPFFSLKQTGTGLGLAIVRRTVEAHGGTVAAARSDAGGLRFSIDLPAGATAGNGGAHA
ncbi:MAG TPA: HAMP domain-containing sensor histidine kinase [Candidatus Binatia bacterium]|nr:HAMP domain-containing sensor histidine kinase [Candidatus Binatia bacterium]